MEFDTEEMSGKPCIQTNAPDSPMGSEKLEQSRSDLTEDEDTEMQTAESEDEIESGVLREMGPGGDGAPSQNKINNNPMPTIVGTGQAVDIKSTGDYSAKGEIGGGEESKSFGNCKVVDSGKSSTCASYPQDEIITTKICKSDGDFAISVESNSGVQCTSKPTPKKAEAAAQFATLGHIIEPNLSEIGICNENRFAFQEKFMKSTSPGEEEEAMKIKIESTEKIPKNIPVQLIGQGKYDVIVEPVGPMAPTIQIIEDFGEDSDESNKYEVEAAAPLQVEQSEIPTSKEREESWTKFKKPETIEENNDKGEVIAPPAKQDDDKIALGPLESKIAQDLSEDEIEEIIEIDTNVDDRALDLLDLEHVESQEERQEASLKVRKSFASCTSVEPLLQQIPEMDETDSGLRPKGDAEEGEVPVDLRFVASADGEPEAESSDAGETKEQEPGTSQGEKLEEMEADQNENSEKFDVSQQESTDEVQTEETGKMEAAEPEGEKLGKEETKSEQVEGKIGDEKFNERGTVSKDSSTGWRNKAVGKTAATGRESCEEGGQDSQPPPVNEEVYLRPRGRAFPFKLQILRLPTNTAREEVVKLFSQCGEVLKVWHDTKISCTVLMADEHGFKKALGLKGPYFGSPFTYIKSSTEAVAVVTGISPQVPTKQVEQELRALIEPVGVCVCRVRVPLIAPITEECPASPLQGHAYLHFPDPHSLEKVRGTLKLEVAGKEVGMMPSRGAFEERFCVNVTPMRGELQRAALDAAVRQVLAPAGRIANVNFVQPKAEQPLSANVLFDSQAAAKKAVSLADINICGLDVTVVPFNPSVHSPRDWQLCMKISSLPNDVTEDDIVKHFSIAGEPVEVRLETPERCMLIYDTETSIQRCLSLHQTYMKNHRISVHIGEFRSRGNNRMGFRRQGNRFKAGQGGSTNSGRGGGSTNGRHEDGESRGCVNAGEPESVVQQSGADMSGGGQGRRNREFSRPFRGGGRGGGPFERGGRGGFPRGAAPRFSHSRGFARSNNTANEAQ